MGAAGAKVVVAGADTTYVGAAGATVVTADADVRGAEMYAGAGAADAVVVVAYAVGTAEAKVVWPVETYVAGAGDA